MPLVVLGVKIEDRSAIKQYRRQWPRIEKETLQAVAMRWHQKMLGSHFTPGNRTRYRLEKRNRIYLEKIKPETGRGQGRFVELQLKGTSQRMLKHFARLTGTKSKAVLRMNAPAYFTNPFTGSFYDPQRKRTKTVRKQPNKPAETTDISRQDREDLRNFCQRELRRRLRELRKSN